MSLPPQGTLLLQDVEALGPNSVLGLDTQFFTVKNLLKGVKLIPKGLHFLHYSESLDQGSSVRYGWWFHCDDQQVVTWNIKAETVLSAARDPDMHDLGLFYPYMVEYPEDREKWAELTRFLDMEVVEEYVANPKKPISTATPSSEENMVLLDILRQKTPNQKFSQADQDELRYTIIQTHKRREETSGSEVTGDFLDRSWYLESLFAHDPSILLAEVQLSFLHFLILGNVCSLTQWTALLSLISSSRSFLEKKQAFSTDFLRIFEAQIACFPPEYMAPASASHIVDMESYGEILAKFQDIFGDVPAWKRLSDIHQSKFGIWVPQSSVFDADNFEVYDVENHDSADEDAPAIV